MVCGQIAQNQLETGKQICFTPAEGQKNKEEKFVEGEAYSIEMLISSGDGKPKKSDSGRMNIYKRDASVTYKLKMANSRVWLIYLIIKGYLFRYFCEFRSHGVWS
jgi:hypothetical protein